MRSPTFLKLDYCEVRANQLPAYTRDTSMGSAFVCLKRFVTNTGNDINMRLSRHGSMHSAADWIHNYYKTTAKFLFITVSRLPAAACSYRISVYTFIS